MNLTFQQSVEISRTSPQLLRDERLHHHNPSSPYTNRAVLATKPMQLILVTKCVYFVSWWGNAISSWILRGNRLWCEAFLLPYRNTHTKGYYEFTILLVWVNWNFFPRFHVHLNHYQKVNLAYEYTSSIKNNEHYKIVLLRKTVN